MQAEFPCLNHEGQELSHICLHPDCKQEKIYCDQCVPAHHGHKNISFNRYKNIYAEFNGLSQKTYSSIKNSFKRLAQIIDLCLRKTEDRVLRQFCGSYSPEAFPTLGSVELQQFYGITEQALNNPILLQMLKGKPPVSVSLQLEKYEEDLQNKLIELQSKIVVSINMFASDSEYYMSEIKKKQNYKEEFFFSKHMKNNWLRVHGDGKVLMRPEADGRGLSVYGLVDKPLTAQNNKIGFRILNQNHRFIYFGACIPQLFQKNKFMGPVYEIGNGMFGIRQDSVPGKSAICLHHSMMNFSNKKIVGWDFRVGDKLILEYLESTNQLIFSCNDSDIFRMKISDQGQKVALYPFIGMKYEGEQVMILNKKQCNEPSIKMNKEIMEEGNNKKYKSIFY